MRNNALRIGVEVGVNFILPYLIYEFSEPQIGQVGALLASSIPPILWSAIEFARNRRIDAIAVFAIAGITLSLAAFIGTGSVQLLQMREKLVSVLIALVFLGSAAIGRPLIYELAKAGLARANNHTEVARFERLRNDAYFRNSMLIMTLVWGFGLMADAALSLLLVFTLTIKEYLVVNPIVGYVAMGALVVWNIWFARRRRREGERRRASQAVMIAEAGQMESKE